MKFSGKISILTFVLQGSTLKNEMVKFPFAKFYLFVSLMIAVPPLPNAFRNFLHVQFLTFLVFNFHLFFFLFVCSKCLSVNANFFDKCLSHNWHIKNDGWEKKDYNFVGVVRYTSLHSALGLIGILKGETILKLVLGMPLFIMCGNRLKGE
jgi:hypothetical protein